MKREYLAVAKRGLLLAGVMAVFTSVQRVCSEPGDWL